MTAHPCYHRMMDGLRMVHRPILLALLISFYLSCHRNASPGKSHTATSRQATSRYSKKLLNDLSMLARERPLSVSQVEKWSRALNSDAESLDSFIGAMMADSQFSDELIPRLIAKQKLRTFAFNSVLWGYILKREKAESGKTVLYLRKPCKRSDAVEVTPWWNLGSKVLVCKDSYRPEVFSASTENGQTTYCHSQSGASDPNSQHTSRCGCGANLFRCLPSEKRAYQIRDSLAAEFRTSLAHWARTDMPFSELLLFNASFRDRNAQYVNLRNRLEAEQAQSTAEYWQQLYRWPKTGKWAARHEVTKGQHAGVLTIPHFIYYSTDRRQRMRDFYYHFWCKEPAAVGAKPADVLSLGTPDLQFEVEKWDALAKRPICTNCHARLDYGKQFFAGYPDGASTATHFVPGLNAGKVGPLYGDNIRDLRGEIEWTPQGFGKIATRQPEFATCMVRHVGEHVFGHRFDKEISDGLVKKFDAATTSARDLFRQALHLYVQASTESEANRQPTQIEVEDWAEIRYSEVIEEHCSDCHFEGSQLPVLGGPHDSKKLRMSMLQQVAFGRMPKNTTMPAGSRAQLVKGLVASLWKAESDRREAARYFLYHRRSAAMQSISSALELAGDVQLETLGWQPPEMIVRGDKIQLGPSYLGAVGFAAIRACEKEHKDSKAQEACIEKRVKLGPLIKNTDERNE